MRAPLHEICGSENHLESESRAQQTSGGRHNEASWCAGYLGNMPRKGRARVCGVLTPYVACTCRPSQGTENCLLSAKERVACEWDDVEGVNTK
jgi:hypothetical protein